MSRRNKTRVQLPFTDSWFCFWGGDTEELNHHHGVSAQKYAFDFIKTNDSGDFYDGEPSNKNSLSFGQPIIAPADGEVIEVVDGIRDNPVGVLNTYNIFGNYLLIKHKQNEFSVLAHLKQGSLTVNAGDKIKVGQTLAQCGNSGYSTDAHIHYHMQDSDTLAKVGSDYTKIDVAKGMKVFFEGDISPIKGDKVANV